MKGLENKFLNDGGKCHTVYAVVKKMDRKALAELHGQINWSKCSGIHVQLGDGIAVELATDIWEDRAIRVIYTVFVSKKNARNC